MQPQTCSNVNNIIYALLIQENNFKKDTSTVCWTLQSSLSLIYLLGFFNPKVYCTGWSWLLTYFIDFQKQR